MADTGSGGTYISIRLFVKEHYIIGKTEPVSILMKISSL